MTSFLINLDKLPNILQDILRIPMAHPPPPVVHPGAIWGQRVTGSGAHPD